MKKFIACLMVLLMMAATALAVVSPSDDFYVLDKANVLDADTEGMIVFSNDLLAADCGAQLVVVTVDSTGNEDIADYAYELFNDWGIGDKKAQNGFLLLLAIDDEDYYYLPGTGLDYDMSGGKIRPIIDEYLEPYFAKGDYDEGVSQTFEQLFAKMAKVCGSDATTAQGKKDYEKWLSSDDPEPITRTGSSSERERRSSGPSFSTIVFIIIVLVLFFGGGSRRRRRGMPFFPLFFHTIHTHHTPPRRGPAPRVHINLGGGHGPRTGGGGRATFGSGMNRSSFGGSRPSGGRSSFGGGRSGFGGGRSGFGGGSRGGGGGRGR